VLDLKRPIDKEGKRHCLQLSQVLNALKISFDLIVSSPLKRSVQTASLIGTETGYEAPIQLSDRLAPEASFSDFQQLLKEVGDRENVLVVGHNPNISNFLGTLLVSQAGGQKIANVRLRKGSLAKLSLTPAQARGQASLQLLLDPRTVRALYSTSTKRSRLKTSRK